MKILRQDMSFYVFKLILKTCNINDLFCFSLSLLLAPLDFYIQSKPVIVISAMLLAKDNCETKIAGFTNILSSLSR